MIMTGEMAIAWKGVGMGSCPIRLSLARRLTMIASIPPLPRTRTHIPAAATAASRMVWPLNRARQIHRVGAPLGHIYRSRQPTVRSHQPHILRCLPLLLLSRWLPTSSHLPTRVPESRGVTDLKRRPCHLWTGTRETATTSTAATVRTRANHATSRSNGKLNFRRFPFTHAKMHPTNRLYRKHLKTHDKPVYCPFTNDPNYPCRKPRAAEQRDMERHVVSHHPEWARQHGFEAGGIECGCGETFTREDNFKRHQKKCSA